MDSIEAEDHLFAISDAKLHGAMCKQLSTIVHKIVGIFPILEASKPRSMSRVQPLSSLHVSIDMARSLLQHCSKCSKLYLAITADSILANFEKARYALEESLRNAEDPQSIGCQIMEIVGELERTVFNLDPLEKQVGDELITLLQKEKRLDNNSDDGEELEVFCQAASKLGLVSSKLAFAERRALKSLIETARTEEDKRKESIAAYLLHLMRKYSKNIRNETSEDDAESPGYAPCSPAALCSIKEVGGNGQAIERKVPKPGSLNSNLNDVKSIDVPIPTEKLRCPISLQLMYDPVIISSGETYERACIEKWFRDGHNTCPKTQQKLSHLCYTSDYSVRGLISSWCKQNGVQIPNGPPESLDLNYWRLALSEDEATESRSLESSDSCQVKEVQPVPSGKSVVEKLKDDKGVVVASERTAGSRGFERYDSLLTMLCDDGMTEQKCTTVKEIRVILKDDEQARIYMGANGFVEALVRFLRLAIREGDAKAQESGAMALFNLSVNNIRNTEMLLSAGVIPLLEKMIENPDTYEPATALYLNISCLSEAKPVIGVSQAVPFLVHLLQASHSQRLCKEDAFHTLFNLSTHPGNIKSLIAAGIIDCLHSFLECPITGSPDKVWAKKALAILTNLASSEMGKAEITSTTDLVGTIAGILDIGRPVEQEQAVSCLLNLCEDENCTQIVLQEGVVPSLVAISATGTPKAKEKACFLLKLFREQRQRETSLVQQQLHPVYQMISAAGDGGVAPDSMLVSKSKSARVKRALASIWKPRRS